MGKTGAIVAVANVMHVPFVFLTVLFSATPCRSFYGQEENSKFFDCE